MLSATSLRPVEATGRAGPLPVLGRNSVATAAAGSLAGGKPKPRATIFSDKGSLLACGTPNGALQRRKLLPASRAVAGGARQGVQSQPPARKMPQLTLFGQVYVATAAAAVLCTFFALVFPRPASTIIAVAAFVWMLICFYVLPPFLGA